MIQSAAPQLRLFSCDDEGASRGPSLDLTLCQVIERYFLPAKRNAARTEALHLAAGDYWRRITGDPPLYEVDDALCAAFRAALTAPGAGVRSGALAPATIDRLLRDLQAVLVFCGPKRANKRSRKNLALWSEPPYLERVERPKKEPQTLSVRELRRVYETTRIMRSPVKAEGLPAPEFWRRLIALAYYVGLRIGTLMELRSAWLTDPPDEWEWPDDLPGKLLAIPGRCFKGERMRSYERVYKYVPPHVVDLLLRFRTNGLLLPFPGWLERGGQSSAMHEAHRRLLARAGVERRKTRNNSFHIYRKTHVTIFAEYSDFADNLAFVADSANHASRQTTQDFYLHQRAVCRRHAIACQQVPPLF